MTEGLQKRIMKNSNTIGPVLNTEVIMIIVLASYLGSWEGDGRARVCNVRLTKRNLMSI